MGTDIPAGELAQMLGVTRRMATKILATWANGGTYRGVAMRVSRHLATDVGRGGMHYTVSRDDIRRAGLGEPSTRMTPPSAKEDSQPRALPPTVIVLNPAAKWRDDLAGRIADAGAPGSRARAAELALMARSVCWPAGKRKGRPIGERTLRGWVAAHDKQGMVTAPRLGRSDRGKPRVIAWRALDRAMNAAGLPEHKQHEIAKDLREVVRGLCPIRRRRSRLILSCAMRRPRPLANVWRSKRTVGTRSWTIRPLHSRSSPPRRGCAMSDERRHPMTAEGSNPPAATPAGGRSPARSINGKGPQ